ncbi:hypothetical protein [Sulfurospirillum arcachonense]|uniref:hypothetical protein n=1 Tax=Sulfurospirillum arcachonense TaxID=57666 RepID=UPI00046AE4BE|nr:hypothetical protein [Sulfurospirillum arcachonense]
MEGLRDIKGLISIEDYSLYIFIIIVFLALIVLYFLIKKIVLKKRAKDPIKIAKKELKNLDLEDTKTSAYTLSKYAPLLSEEDFAYLKKYKYKKNIEEFSNEDLEKIKRFIDGI